MEPAVQPFAPTDPRTTGAHDATFACAGDTTEFVFGEESTEGSAVEEVVFFFDSGGAKDADVSDEIGGGGNVGVVGDGLLFFEWFAIDGGRPWSFSRKAARISVTFLGLSATRR